MSNENISAVEALQAVLPRGAANAKPRAQLARELGLSDRNTRALIEAARNEGLLICNEQNGHGYYIASDLDEIERTWRQMRSRAIATFRAARHFRRALKEAGREVH